MKKLLLFLIPGIALLPFALAGCDSSMHPEYSSNVKYGVREDPILKGSSNQLGDERYEPDRPGVFPIKKLDDVLKPDNPLYPKRDAVMNPEVMVDPTNISSSDRKELEAALEKIFGTPAKPKVDVKAAEIADDDGSLKLDDETLAKGSTRYRVHCLHCHGVPGDGRGPTARWINPHPRDFRAGKFKFQSVSQLEGVRHPARQDLLRTLRNGLEGTAMPTFNLLKDDELESLASYVIHLSLRGEVELQTIINSFEMDQKTKKLERNNKDPILAMVKERTQTIHAKWRLSQQPSEAIVVAPYPYKDGMADLKASVLRGQMLFLGKPSEEFRKEYHKRRGPATFAELKADRYRRTVNEIKAADPKKSEAEVAKAAEEKLRTAVETTLDGALKLGCVNCHIDYGRQAKFRFDDWATLVRPNNFPNGVFRGGHRPVDLYFRIHSGITGSNMTPFGTKFDGNDIWDLVNFVSNLSYAPMLKQLDVNLDPQ